MLNCSALHQFSHHMHNYTDITFKTPGRLRGLICIHALYNTWQSLLAVRPLFLCLCYLNSVLTPSHILCVCLLIYSAKYVFISKMPFLLISPDWIEEIHLKFPSEGNFFSFFKSSPLWLQSLISQRCSGGNSL